MHKFKLVDLTFLKQFLVSFVKNDTGTILDPNALIVMLIIKI